MLCCQPNNPNNPNNFSYEKISVSYDVVRPVIAHRKSPLAHRSESSIREASPLPDRRTKTQPPPAAIHPAPGCHPSTYNWQTHFASWFSYGTGRTGRHFSYKRRLSSYKKSATIPPPLSVHPEHRNQVVHPTVRLDVQPAPGVEGHAPQLRHAAKNPKLNSYANAASAATHGSPKMCHSYDVGPLPALGPAQITPKTPSHSYVMRPIIPS